jgi:hypothetical protein
VIDHIKIIRKRKTYTRHTILPLTGNDLRKFREYYPECPHVNVIVSFYYRMVVVIPCETDGKSEWDGGGLVELDWSDAAYEKSVQEIEEGRLIDW